MSQQIATLQTMEVYFALSADMSAALLKIVNAELVFVLIWYQPCNITEYLCIVGSLRAHFSVEPEVIAEGCDHIVLVSVASLY